MIGNNSLDSGHCSGPWYLSLAVCILFMGRENRKLSILLVVHVMCGCRVLGYWKILSSLSEIVGVVEIRC